MLINIKNRSVSVLILIVYTGASHQSVIPNICYIAAFQLAGRSWLQLKLAGSLCQLVESFTKLSWLAVGYHFLNAQSSKLTRIWRVLCRIYWFEITNRIYVDLLKIYIYIKVDKTCYYLTGMYAKYCQLVGEKGKNQLTSKCNPAGSSNKQK